MLRGIGRSWATQTLTDTCDAARNNALMSAEVCEVKVRKDLEDLVPTFLDNRRKELAKLPAALDVSDYEQLRYLGHRMKGSGSSYGFEFISVLGRKIDEAARSGDSRSVATYIDDYTNYLSRIHVTYE